MADGSHLTEAALKAANINPATGLATDYLNHYNEVAMMIGMLADTPDLIEPVLDWRPVGYAAHFHLTGFSDRTLVVAAYEAASEATKTRFREARRNVELAIAEVQDLIEASAERRIEASAHAPGIFALISRVGGVINGERIERSRAQANVDAHFPGNP